MLVQCLHAAGGAEKVESEDLWDDIVAAMGVQGESTARAQIVSQYRQHLKWVLAPSPQDRHADDAWAKAAGLPPLQDTFAIPPPPAGMGPAEAAWRRHAVAMRIVSSWRASRKWLAAHVFGPDSAGNKHFSGAFAAGLEPARMSPGEVAAFPHCAEEAASAVSRFVYTRSKRKGASAAPVTGSRKAASEDQAPSTPSRGAPSTAPAPQADEGAAESPAAASPSPSTPGVGQDDGEGGAPTNAAAGAGEEAAEAGAAAPTPASANTEALGDVDTPEVASAVMAQEQQGEEGGSSGSVFDLASAMSGDVSGASAAAAPALATDAVSLDLVDDACPWVSPPLPPAAAPPPAPTDLPKPVTDAQRQACRWARARHAAPDKVIPLASDGSLEPQPWHTTCLDCNQAFLDVRNHILLRWVQRPQQLLTPQEALMGLPSFLHEFTLRVFFFLAVTGFINHGAVALPRREGEAQGAGLPTRPATKHVAVVGAGIAGLTTARQLTLLGYRVTVLEARSRVGGRVHTVRNAVGCNADAGAMVTTGDEPNPAAMLARQASLPVYNLSNSVCRILLPLSAQPSVTAFNNSHLEAQVRGIVVGGVIAYHAYQSLLGPRRVAAMEAVEAEADVLHTLAAHRESPRGQAIVSAGPAAFLDMGRVPPALWRRLASRQAEAAELAAAVKSAEGILAVTDVLPPKFGALVPQGVGRGPAPPPRSRDGRDSKAKKKKHPGSTLAEGTIPRTAAGVALSEFEAGLLDDLLRGDTLPDVGASPKGDIPPSLAQRLRSRKAQPPPEGCPPSRFLSSTLYTVVDECAKLAAAESLRLSQHLRLLRRLHAVLDACASDAVGASDACKRRAQGAALRVARELALVCNWLGMPAEWHLVGKVMACYVGSGDASGSPGVPLDAKGFPSGPVLGAAQPTLPVRSAGTRGGGLGLEGRAPAAQCDDDPLRIAGFPAPRALDAAAESQYNALLAAANDMRGSYRAGGALPPSITSLLPAPTNGKPEALSGDVRSLIMAALEAEEDPHGVNWPAPRSRRKKDAAGDVELPRQVAEAAAAWCAVVVDAPPKAKAGASKAGKAASVGGSKRRREDTPTPASQGEPETPSSPGASSKRGASAASPSPVPSAAGASDLATPAPPGHIVVESAFSDMWSSPSALLRACGVVLRGWSGRAWDVSLGAAAEFISKLRAFTLAHNSGVPLSRVLPPPFLEQGVLQGLPLAAVSSAHAGGWKRDRDAAPAEGVDALAKRRKAGGLTGAAEVLPGITGAQLHCELRRVLHLNQLPLPTPAGDAAAISIKPKTSFDGDGFVTLPVDDAGQATHGCSCEPTAGLPSVDGDGGCTTAVVLGQDALTRQASSLSAAGDAALRAAAAALAEGQAGDPARQQEVTADAVTDALVRWHVSNLEYGCAAPLSRVSLRHWDQDDADNMHNYGRHTMLKCGYDGIIRAVAKDIPVTLRAPVASIEYAAAATPDYIGSAHPLAAAGGSSAPAVPACGTSTKSKGGGAAREDASPAPPGAAVRIALRNGEEVTADAAVVTLPLGCLKAGDVQFEPALPPAKQAAVEAMGNGLLNKVILRFPHAFWRRAGAPLGVAEAEDASATPTAEPAPAKPPRGGHAKKPLTLASASGASDIPPVMLLPGVRLHSRYVPDDIVRKACALLLKAGSSSVHDVVDALLISSGGVAEAEELLKGGAAALAKIAAKRPKRPTAQPSGAEASGAGAETGNASPTARSRSASESESGEEEEEGEEEAGVIEDMFGRAQLDPSDPRGEGYMFWALDRLTGGSPTLIAMMAGEAAEWVEGVPDDQVLTRVMKALQDLFGPHTPPPTSYYVTRWGSDPHSRGAYSHIPVGSTGHAYDVLAAPVGLDNCLCFAGEATNRQHPTTVAGAYETGLREAARVHKQLSGWDTVPPHQWSSLAQTLYT